MKSPREEKHATPTWERLLILNLQVKLLAPGHRKYNCRRTEYLEQVGMGNSFTSRVANDNSPHRTMEYLLTKSTLL